MATIKGTGSTKGVDLFIKIPDKAIQRDDAGKISYAMIDAQVNQSGKLYSADEIAKGAVDAHPSLYGGKTKDGKPTNLAYCNGDVLQNIMDKAAENGDVIHKNNTTYAAVKADITSIKKSTGSGFRISDYNNSDTIKPSDTRLTEEGIANQAANTKTAKAFEKSVKDSEKADISKQAEALGLESFDDFSKNMQKRDYYDEYSNLAAKGEAMSPEQIYADRVKICQEIQDAAGSVKSKYDLTDIDYSKMDDVSAAAIKKEYVSQVLDAHVECSRNFYDEHRDFDETANIPTVAFDDAVSKKCVEYYGDASQSREHVTNFQVNMFRDLDNAALAQAENSVKNISEPKNPSYQTIVNEMAAKTVRRAYDEDMCQKSAHEAESESEISEILDNNEVSINAYKNEYNDCTKRAMEARYKETGELNGNFVNSFHCDVIEKCKQIHEQINELPVDSDYSKSNSVKSSDYSVIIRDCAEKSDFDVSKAMEQCRQSAVSSKASNLAATVSDTSFTAQTGQTEHQAGD